MIAFLVRSLFVLKEIYINSILLDNPSAKFGEALRAQVEERLEFFDKGTAPSKNADAMRKVLESMAIDDDEDGSDDDVEKIPLPLLEPSPKKSKKAKKDGKDKKRKADEMDVDEEEEEEQSTKKVKLSKEEKKALKKAAKAAAKVCSVMAI